jgi:hypothetical protein
VLEGISIMFLMSRGIMRSCGGEEEEEEEGEWGRRGEACKI